MARGRRSRKRNRSQDRSSATQSQNAILPPASSSNDESQSGAPPASPPPPQEERPLAETDQALKTLDMALLNADLRSRLHDLVAENRHLRRLVGRVRRRKGWARRVRVVQKNWHALRRRRRLKNLSNRLPEDASQAAILTPLRHFEILVIHDSPDGDLARCLAPLKNLGEACREVSVWVDPKIADGTDAWSQAHAGDHWQVYGGSPLPDWNEVLDSTTGSLLVVLWSNVSLEKRGILSLVHSLTGPPKASASSACLQVPGDVLVPSLAWNRGEPQVRWSSPLDQFEDPLVLGGLAFAFEKAAARMDGLKLNAGCDQIALSLSRHLRAHDHNITCAANAQAVARRTLPSETGAYEATSDHAGPQLRSLMTQEWMARSPALPFHLGIPPSLLDALPPPDRSMRLLAYDDPARPDAVLMTQPSDLDRLPTRKWLGSTRALLGDIGPTQELISLARQCDLVLCPDQDLAHSWREAIRSSRPLSRQLPEVKSTDGIEELVDTNSWGQWLQELED